RSPARQPRSTLLSREEHCHYQPDPGFVSLSALGPYLGCHEAHVPTLDRSLIFSTELRAPFEEARAGDGSHLGVGPANESAPVCEGHNGAQPAPARLRNLPGSSYRLVAPLCVFDLPKINPLPLPLRAPTDQLAEPTHRDASFYAVRLHADRA